MFVCSIISNVFFITLTCTRSIAIFASYFLPQRYVRAVRRLHSRVSAPFHRTNWRPTNQPTLLPLTELLYTCDDIVCVHPPLYEDIRHTTHIYRHSQTYRKGGRHALYYVLGCTFPSTFHVRFGERASSLRLKANRRI